MKSPRVPLRGPTVERGQTLSVACWESGGERIDDLNKPSDSAQRWPTSVTWGSRVKRRCILGGGTASFPPICSPSRRTPVGVRERGAASRIPCTTMLKCMETRLSSPRPRQRAGERGSAGVEQACRGTGGGWAGHVPTARDRKKQTNKKTDNTSSGTSRRVHGQFYARFLRRFIAHYFQCFQHLKGLSFFFFFLKTG